LPRAWCAAKLAPHLQRHKKALPFACHIPLDLLPTMEDTNVGCCHGSLVTKQLMHVTAKTKNGYRYSTLVQALPRKKCHHGKEACTCHDRPCIAGWSPPFPSNIDGCHRGHKNKVRRCLCIAATSCSHGLIAAHHAL
jgi:hypothetical protein